MNVGTNVRIIAKKSICFFLTGILVSIFFMTGCGKGGGSVRLKETLPNLKSNQDIIDFTFQKINDLYIKIVEINDKVTLIDIEIERLTQIEKKYPKQQKIVKQEKTNWKKIKKQLLSALEKVEKEVETIYVSSLVNEEKGKAIIKQQTKALVGAADGILKETKAGTARLKSVDVEKGLVGNIKGFFS
jgi:hypothetical protein